VLGVKAFLTEVSAKMAVILLLLFTFLRFLSYRLGRFQMSSGVAGGAVTFQVEDDRLGEASKSQEFHCGYWKFPPWGEGGQQYLQRNLL
jgi:hypothetical protein